MSSSVIDKLKNTLGMGARSNKYKVTINGVGGGPSGEMVDTLVKTASIPGRSFHEVEVWNQGRLTVVAGEADFGGTWSVTFMDTQDHALRSQFIAWMEFVDSVATHSRGAADHSSYMTTAILEQLNTSTNASTAKYTFEDLWPKSISDSAMSDETSDIVEFTVEFNYTSWAMNGSGSGGESGDSNNNNIDWLLQQI